ncbi:glycerol-3-phosphate ABC transporter ATP-binding protein [Bosea thiooxidans]|uniref:Glycerol-3-phosphate ABC transporter ATP-binding protein n=1 Tax=Bosea thiooxidans TaxID=53254 RepID=A0A0Q3HZL2_9HYPH|nr:ABC transporter ATP-binding protein [Bosea thiooxidans]KQK28215.1 glycerol-3-phosphate ABC transporter ATP-binding protein [Bosea thiooxidans]SKB48198.1 multiple sugar transport system ATP-binding protein [Bosea thiooxidans]
MATVALSSIAKSFGSTKVLGGVDLDIADGEFLTLVGPSGCGKSTLIRIIAGLEHQDGGGVAIGGSRVDHLRPHERRVAMVFQSYALYPHMSVRANIALPLTMSRLSLRQRLPLLRLLSRRRREVMRGIEADVGAVAMQLQLDHLLDRKPAQLSGGQRQRVALGRAMVRQPAVFLMDEPLSNLDAKLRVHMRTELAELHKRLGATFIYVTHDQVEAMTMSDRVAMMDSGSILQLGTPSRLYEKPASLKVAQFIGSPAINLLPATVAAAGRLELFGRPMALAVPLAQGQAVTLGIRSEALALVHGEPGAPGRAWFTARLRRKENLGSEYILHFDLAGRDAQGVTMRTTPAIAAGLSEAAEVTLGFDEAACHIFGTDGGRVEPRGENGATGSVVPLRA